MRPHPLVAGALLCGACSFPGYKFDDDLFASLSAPQDAGTRAPTPTMSTGGDGGASGSSAGGASSNDASVRPGGAGNSFGGSTADSGVGGATGGLSGTSGGGSGGDTADAGPVEACEGTCFGVPGGWTGPLAIWTGAPADAPACTGAYPTVAFSGSAGVVAPPANCPTCSCDADGLSCGDAELYFYEEAMCPNPVSSQGAEASYVGDSRFLTSEIDVCYGLDPLTGDQAAGARFTVSGGPCNPVSTGTVEKEDYAWQTAMVACSAGDALARTCDDGLPCAPDAAAVFAQLCVARSGVHECPSAYSERSVYYRDADDTRSCSACGCADAECDGSFELFADVNCLTTATQVGGAVEGCSPFAPGADQGSGYTTGGIYRGGTVECAPTGGQSSGGVTPTDPVTICCP